MTLKNRENEPTADLSPQYEHEEDEQTDSEDEAQDDLNQVAGTSASGAALGSKKKKKKRSKVAKALNALKGKSEIPDALVNEVLDKVKAEGNVPEEELTVENIREVLDQLKIMDVVQGKAGLGGINKKDMGEHKVSGLYFRCSQLM